MSAQKGISPLLSMGFVQGSLEEATKKPPVPAVYILKYNRFVDNILEKMNDILRSSYDPVSVKLQPIDASKKTTKPKKQKTKTKKRKTTHKKKNSARAGNKKQEIIPSTEPTVQDIKQITPDQITVTEENKINEMPQNDSAIQSRAIKEPKAKPTTKPKPGKATPKPTKVTTKAPNKVKTKSTTAKPIKNKTKATPEKSKPRAKGTLYGLSSLRRTGDVAVSIMADHTSVKSNFAIGPLILRVEKEVGRGGKKEVKSATATTAEMMGKLTLRVNNQGVATLHSIRVLQPKQVRVDSNHERTRELVWRRSARIAHVVSEKLLTVSKPMFTHTTVA